MWISITKWEFRECVSLLLRSVSDAACFVAKMYDDTRSSHIIWHASDHASDSCPFFDEIWLSHFKLFLFVCAPFPVYPVCHYFVILISIVLIVASVDEHLPFLAACHCTWLLMLKIVIGCYLANKILSLSHRESPEKKPYALIGVDACTPG